MIARDIDRILRLVSSLDEDILLEFSDSLAYLALVLESRKVSDAKKAITISGVGKYISKRAAAIDPDKASDAIVSLKALRNELAHGKISKRQDFSKHYPQLWNAISRASEEMRPSDMENLLAYSMNVRNQQLAEHGVLSRKISMSYKRKFQSLSADDKRQAFIEILLTFFSDKRFSSSLDRRGL